MTLPTWYDAGTVSVANGSAMVTGTGTAWGGDAIMAGDLFCDPAQPLVPPQRVKEVHSDTSLELWSPWPGAAITDDPYEIRYVGIIERSTGQTRKVLEELGKVSPYYDVQVANLASRASYDGQPAGFAVLVSNIGDGRAAIYSKASNAVGDWTAPAYFTGPQGGKGDTGAPGPSGAIAAQLPPQGRLSLVSGNPLPETDVTGATTIYYVPCNGQFVPVFDGTGFISRSIGSQLVLPLTAGDATYYRPHSANVNIDVFAFWMNGQLTLGTVTWSSGDPAGNDVSRGVGNHSAELELHLGILVNKNLSRMRWGAGQPDWFDVPARRGTYLGTFRPVVSGQATDTRSRRLLFNAYNQALRPLRCTEPSANWFYATAAWRQANGNANNQVEVLAGLSGLFVDLNLLAFSSNDTATKRNVRVAIGLDSTTARDPQGPGGAGGVDNTTALILTTFWKGHPGLGRHVLTWLEHGSGSDNQRWFGTDLTNGNYATGLYGTVTI